MFKNYERRTYVNNSQYLVSLERLLWIANRLEELSFQTQVFANVFRKCEGGMNLIEFVFVTVEEVQHAQSSNAKVSVEHI